MEEDIKILERVLQTKDYGLCEVTDTFYTALENLLTRYKQLEADNKRIIIQKAEALQEVRKYKAKLKNYIPKSKIKEKIEELNELIIETQKELGSASKEFTIYVHQEKALQELLEEE